MPLTAGWNGTTAGGADVNIFDDLWECGAVEWTWEGGVGSGWPAGNVRDIGGRLPRATFPRRNTLPPDGPMRWGDFWMFGGFGE
jgi:hypothetical protein